MTERRAPEAVFTPDSPRLHLAVWSRSGPGLLLVHGMGGNTAWWDAAAPLLAERFAVAALDFHGHGDSDWLPDGRYTPQGYAEDIESARRALGWESFFLAAHSLGARVALDYARRFRGRARAVAAIDFAPELGADSQRFAKIRRMRQPHFSDLEPMLERFHLEPPGTLLAREQLRVLAARCARREGQGWTWKFDWRAFLFAYESIWGWLPEVKVPALVVRGERSAIIDAPTLARVAAAIPGAKAVEVPEAHHHVPLERPAETARLIRDFFSGL